MWKKVKKNLRETSWSLPPNPAHIPVFMQNKRCKTSLLSLRERLVVKIRETESGHHIDHFLHHLSDGVPIIPESTLRCCSMRVTHR